MKAGRFTTSTLLRKLGAYSKKNRLTLIVQGDSDKIVPQQQAQSIGAWAKAGVAHKLDVIPGGGHDGKTFRLGVMKVRIPVNLNIPQTSCFWHCWPSTNNLLFEMPQHPSVSFPAFRRRSLI